MNLRNFVAPAKLNLFLHVTGRRADGYHLLESVFVLLDHGDQVQIEVATDGAIRRLRDIPGVPEDQDLTVRAACALKSATGTALGAHLLVDKHIPQGGGLGGGSSDAATVLLALNHLWRTGLSRAELARIGLALGADVPFFIFGRDAFARGIGEDLVAVAPPRRWYLVLVPACMVPTVEIFRAPDLTRNTESVKIADFSAGQWQFPEPRFRNDLQPVACAKYPAVARALEWLRAAGAGAQVSARMSGSGACVFAGFDSRDAALAALAEKPADVSGFVAQGLSEHPLAGLARD